MGNICRSPTAEGVFRHFVAQAGLTGQTMIDSAGTHAYHQGEAVDRRAIAAAKARGYSLSELRARKVVEEDFEKFDYILAMDRDNLASLIELAMPEHRPKIRLFLEFSGGPGDEVPDPYYGSESGFERVLDLVEEASRGLLETLQKS